MSRRLTKELVLQWLKEAGGWEAGHNELFEYKHWSLGIHKEDDSYQPFTFGVAGHHKGTAETICRRYRSIEEAMLHVVNGFNENANVRNPYASLDEAMNDTLGWLARVNTKISYLYRDADNYKMRHEVVIAGSMSEEQGKAIEDSLDEGVYFIPSQVGLPDDRFGSVTAADHPWFEWVGVEPTADRPTLHVTAEELTAKFVDAANGWTESADAPADGLRPYSVTVRETLSRSVIIWADSHEGAEEKAADLSNDGTISLTDQDFIDREIECNGVAGAYDLSTFKQFFFSSRRRHTRLNCTTASREATIPTKPTTLSRRQTSKKRRMTPPSKRNSLACSTAAQMTRTSTANPCALLSLRERWSASERRVMRLAGLAYWLR